MTETNTNPTGGAMTPELKEEILKYLDDVIVPLRASENSQEWLTRTGHLIGKIHAETTPNPFAGEKP